MLRPTNLNQLVLIDGWEFLLEIVSQLHGNVAQTVGKTRQSADNRFLLFIGNEGGNKGSNEKGSRDSNCNELLISC